MLKEKKPSISIFAKKKKCYVLCNIYLPISKIRVAVIPAIGLRYWNFNLKNKVDSHVYLNKRKRSQMSWFRGIVATSLQKTFPKLNTKRQKLFIQCQHSKKQPGEKRKRKNGIVLFCFWGRWAGHCLVCKSIKSSCTHPTIPFLIHRQDCISFLRGLSEGWFFFPSNLCIYMWFLHFNACELVYLKWADHNCKVSSLKM